MLDSYVNKKKWEGGREKRKEKVHVLKVEAKPAIFKRPMVVDLVNEN